MLFQNLICKSYLFSFFFITALNHCLKLIWICYYIIHFKQSIADLLFLVTCNLLSSAQYASYTSLIKKIKAFIRILNKMDPNIEPCGIPDKSI